jgi:hypothetical protein
LLPDEDLSFELDEVVAKVQTGLFTLRESQQNTAQVLLRVNVIWQLLPIYKSLNSKRVLFLVFQSLPLCDDVALILMVTFYVFYLDRVRSFQAIFIIMVAFVVLRHFYNVFVVDGADYLASFWLHGQED